MLLPVYIMRRNSYTTIFKVKNRKGDTEAWIREHVGGLGAGKRAGTTNNIIDKKKLLTNKKKLV